jgi:dUTP pyrophosphatase
MSNYDGDHQFAIFRTDPKAKMPTRGTAESAGYDLYSIESGVLYPGETKIFSVGLIIKPPFGYHVKIWGRSGFGSKYGVGIPHAMGLIDRDFCGPDDVMKIVLHRACMNGHNKDYLKPLEISVGDRIAQMTIEKTIDFNMIEVDNPPSNISRGGFGSTGVK